ncbi:helix-turn-helix domain-containing protein [Streptomyces sp. NPDC087219]|uniref:helix-turn-helix domain-containing protein n=1 Tax=unclassified Streptomyces TaxID=2593676 RepID=UPI0038165F4E
MAEHLLISQPEISHSENGRRVIKPRDVRDLCDLYGVTDRQVVDALMRRLSRGPPHFKLRLCRQHRAHHPARPFRPRERRGVSGTVQQRLVPGETIRRTAP